MYKFECKGTKRKQYIIPEYLIPIIIIYMCYVYKSNGIEYRYTVHGKGWNGVRWRGGSGKEEWYDVYNNKNLELWSSSDFREDRKIKRYSFLDIDLKQKRQLLDSPLGLNTRVKCQIHTNIYMCVCTYYIGTYNNDVYIINMLQKSVI